MRHERLNHTIAADALDPTHRGIYGYEGEV